MDIRDKIEAIAAKVKGDKNLLAKFQKNPASVIEELIGVDLPDDQVNKAVEAVKAKISLDKVGDMLGGLLGKK